MFDRTAIRQLVAPQSIIATGLTVAHSLRARGLRNTLLFAALGISLPTVAEYVAVNITNILQHRTHPQVKGVALGAALGWYNIGYASYAMVESIGANSGITATHQRLLRSAGTGVVATSLDLIMDCIGLDFGLWEWTNGGQYARDITGPNGQAGIPISNFIGWIILTSGVTGLYQLLAENEPRVADGGGRAGSPSAGRTAALLFSPYYLASVVWALEQRKLRFLLYSCVCPVAIVAALRGRFQCS